MRFTALLALLVFTNYAHSAAPSTTAAPQAASVVTPYTYAPPNIGCTQAAADATAARTGAKGKSLETLISLQTQCKNQQANAAPVDPKGPATSAADRAKITSKTAFQKQCLEDYQGTSGECFVYSAHTASQKKKEAADLTEQLNTATEKSLQSDQNYQSNSQNITDDKNKQFLAMTSSLPAEKNKATLAAQQHLRDQNTDLQKNFTDLQNKYTEAQTTYEKNMSSLQQSCYAQAQAKYNALKATIDAKKQGGGVSTSGNIALYSKYYRNYQTNQYNACLANVASVQQAKQYGADLASAQTQLQQQADNLTVQRANFNRQLQTNLATIQTEYQDKMNGVQQTFIADNGKLQALAENYGKEKMHNQDVIANLQKQIDNAKHAQDCIESYSGTSGKSDGDDDDSLADAATAAIAYAGDCDGQDVGYCEGACKAYLSNSLAQSRYKTYTSANNASSTGGTGSTGGSSSGGTTASTATAAPAPSFKPNVGTGSGTAN